jgi:hypothetical protein
MFYDRIRKHLVQNPKELEEIVAKLVEDAKNGQPWAVKEIMDRVDGKAVQATEISGIDGDAVELKLIEFVIKRPE